VQSLKCRVQLAEIASPRGLRGQSLTSPAVHGGLWSRFPFVLCDLQGSASPQAWHDPAPGLGHVIASDEAPPTRPAAFTGFEPGNGPAKFAMIRLAEAGCSACRYRATSPLAEVQKYVDQVN